MAQRQRTRSPAYRARRTARKLAKAQNQLMDNAALTNSPSIQPQPAKFEGHDAEGLAIYSNVDLS